MNIYRKAVLLGLLIGPVGALLAVVLSFLGFTRELALAAAIGVVGASMGVIALKRDRSQ